MDIDYKRASGKGKECRIEHGMCYDITSMDMLTM